jgi:hypothetical protein
MSKDTVSIEKVLNSRCTCGFETGLRKRHWGTFVNTFLPRSRTDDLLHYCKVPQFSSGKLVQWFSDDRLFVGFEKATDPVTDRLLNIESGMQQQAVYLACAATGLGACILNQGINGTTYGERFATASYVIREMLYPYKSGNFTVMAPGPRRRFLKGRNLTQPVRDGEMECLPELQRLVFYSKKGSQAVDAADVSQLLWAAKGRTPHLIRLQVLKMMWGLTIPTWGGGQDYTSVHVVRDRKNFRYVNLTKGFLPKRLIWEKIKWIQGNPTHDITPIGDISVCAHMDGFEIAIILCRNENTNRALWEVGYMLENMFLQARSLGISFGSKIFTDHEIAQLAEQGLPNAVAALLL